MATPPPPIRVNRAPVMTLWATVVAEPLGYPPETALTLGRFVAESSARWRHAGGKAISNAGEERTDVTGLYAAPTRRAGVPNVDQNPSEARRQRRELLALPHCHDLLDG